MESFLTGVVQQGASLSAITFFYKIVMATFLCFVIAQVYKYTHQSLSYVHTFLHTLIIVGVSCCAVIVIIGNSIPMAFGLLGALSIIRFRTAIKDSRDTGYLFFVIATCMSIAAGLYFIAILFTVLVSLLLIVMYKMDYGLKSVTQKILKVQLPQNRSIQDVVPHLTKHFTGHELMESSWNAEQSQKECVFLVTGRKKPGAEEKALAELQALTGDRSVHLYGYSQTPIL